MSATKNLYVERRLTEASVGYQNGEYVADQAMPILLVADKSGTILEADKAALQADPLGDDAIGQGAEPGLITSELQDLTYSTVERAKGVPVHDDEVDADSAQDAPYEVKIEATNLATERLQLNRELRVATLMTTAANWATGHTASPSTKWDAASGSDPVNDILVGKLKIKADLGIPPNYAVVPWEVLQYLGNNATLLSRVNGGATTDTPALVAIRFLQTVFQIPNILIPSAGAVAGNMSAGFVDGAALSLWGDNVVLFYQPARPMRKSPAAGYTYVWRNAFRGAARNAKGQVITETYIPRKRTLIIDARTYSQEKILIPEAGYVLTNVTSALT